VIIDLLGPVYPYRGGISHYTTRLYRELVAQGHNVRVLNLTRQYPDFLFPGTSQTDTSDAAFEVDSLRTVDSVDPISWARTAQAIRARKTELLIVQWWHSYFTPSFGSIAAAARASGTRVVFLCHNVLPHEAKPWDKWLARAAYSIPHAFVVHARSEKLRLENIVGTRADIRVHPHPVYDLFTPDTMPDKATARAQLAPNARRVVLFFGLIRPYKGVDVLLEALAHIPQQEGIEAVVAGECYDDVARYQSLVQNLNLQERVHLHLRYIPNDEVALFMAAADVVVLPYRNASQSGIVQIAYACGKPVITSRVGGLPDVVHDGQTGLLVPPADPAALAAAIRRFYDEDMEGDLSAGVARAAGEFAWDSMVTTLVHA
jgi:glycosyltransferase involved in cell wall biosynthesis